jgi:hypothetical protein
MAGLVAHAFRFSIDVWCLISFAAGNFLYIDAGRAPGHP